jgi:hypothetical protein
MFLHKNCLFKWQIAIDRHSPRIKLNHSHLSGPLHLSLLSAFKRGSRHEGSGPGPVSLLFLNYTVIKNMTLPLRRVSEVFRKNKKGVCYHPR